MGTGGADSGRPTEWQIAGRTVLVTRLDKSYWPRTGVTKGDMLTYYAHIAPVFLPHLRDRPITLRMYPDGADGPSYYQRACPEHAPAWLRTVPYRPKATSRTMQLPLIDDAAGLIWLANAGALELHTWGARLPELARPDMAIFDLDPGHDASFAEVLHAALRVHEVLTVLGLASFPKTSGGRGLHVVVPLAAEPVLSFERVRGWVRAVAQRMTAADPGLFALPRGSTHEGARVTIDYAQNSIGRNTAAPYTLRASADHPVVATPLSWQEVEVGGFRPDDLTPQVVLDRVRQQGDLFAPVLQTPTALPPLDACS
jgi:bifunctional non-homologous end joining protein LigD